MRLHLLPPLLALVLIASATPPTARAEDHSPAIALATSQTPALNRRYWPVPLDSLAIGRAKHTHVEVRGRVSAVRQEDDGDLHIVLQSLTGPTFIVGECIPSLPCMRPRVGDTIRLRGISRRDPEHPWNEIHPVEALLH